jgi:hypothetical protein
MKERSRQWHHRRRARLLLAGLIVGVAFAIWLGPGNGLSVIGTNLTPGVSRSSAVPTPKPCDPYSAERTRQVITAFLSAYNAGTPDITDRFIAPAGEFQWYGAPDRVFPDNPASIDRTTLPTYFAAEHARGERLELRDFSINGPKYNPDIHDWILNFGYTLTHTVSGANPNPAPGKGALGCTSGKFVLWLIDSW